MRLSTLVSARRVISNLKDALVRRLEMGTEQGKQRLDQYRSCSQREQTTAFYVLKIYFAFVHALTAHLRGFKLTSFADRHSHHLCFCLGAMTNPITLSLFTG